jgi:hypothetical protein
MNNTVKPISKKDVKRGMQVAYIPDHLIEDLTQDDSGVRLIDLFSHISDLSGVELGFITSWNEHGAFCRYFYEGTRDIKTKDNSVLTMWRNIFPIVHTNSRFIYEWLQTNMVQK